MKRSSLSLAGVLAISFTVADLEGGSDWAQWRGPGGNGYVSNCNPPVEWSETKNIRWKVEIPGSGHSSPIVLGERVYVTTAAMTDEKVKSPWGQASDAEAADPPAGRNERRPRDRRGGRSRRRGRRGPQPTNMYQFIVLAIDRNNGREIWRTKVREEVPHEGTHPTASFASSTPATDGDHIYAFFGSRGLFCLDMEGNIKWKKYLGKMRIRNRFGEGASPALHGNTLVVAWDHEGESFVVALDKKSGEQQWRVNRAEPTSWTSPVITKVKGKLQVVLAGSRATISYDLATGKELWRCSGLTMNVVPTPVVGNGMIYLTSGFRGSALQAVKLDEAVGDISDGDAIAWTHGRGTPYVPSPMLSGNKLYFLKGNNGVISCFDAITGVPHYFGERLEEIPNVYASLVGGGGRVYACGREGNVVVLEEGPVFKVLATNSLDDGIDATPAIVGAEIYLRGSKHLFCIAETEE